MKKIFLYLLLLIPTFTIGQTTLTSLSTTRYMTHAIPTIKKLTIYGKELWPKHMTNSMSIELVKVHFKKGTQTAIIPQLSGNASQMTVSFNSADWLTTPGKIEVYINVGSTDMTTWTKTNSLWIDVDQMPNFPPVITDLSPKEFKTGLKREEYMTTILGNFFGEEKAVSVTIGGIAANYGRLDIDNGRMLYWIPVELTTKPGTYDVIVQTGAGRSNAVPITIVAPSTKVTVIKSPIGTTRNQVGAIKQITTPIVKFDPSVNLVAGGRVIIAGTISSEILRTTLINQFSSIDNVVIVKDETSIGENNANLVVNISGEKLTRDKLDLIKSNVEGKMKALGLTPNVVVR